MNINYMREFLVVVETMNFSKAAELLFISQPSLSRHIAALEENLGAQLLDRSTTSVSITAAGSRAYESFRKIVHEYEALQKNIDVEAAGMVKNLKLGILYHTVDEFTIQYVRKFIAACPNVEISYVSGRPDQLREPLI